VIYYSSRAVLKKQTKTRAERVVPARKAAVYAASGAHGPENESSGSNSPAALFRLSGLPPHTPTGCAPKFIHTRARARQRHGQIIPRLRRLFSASSQRSELDFNYRREGCKFCRFFTNHQWAENFLDAVQLSSQYVSLFLEWFFLQ
jgi:hypothetical protein